MSAAKPTPMLLIGLFFGFLAGWFTSFVIADRDASTSGKVIKRSEQPRGAQDERDPHAGADDPHAGADDPHGGADPQAERGQQSIAKVHFMKKFVAALTSTPGNEWPNPDYKPLLKEGATVTCTDCHKSAGLDFEAMRQLDPGSEAVEKYRHSPQFMIPLMMKWVDRLNKQNADRLVKPVTCNDCHAIHPQDAWTTLPPMMVRFVNALKEKPQNKNPAANWKPLLKDPSTTSMLCGTCHGTVGDRMEMNLGQIDTSARNPKYENDKKFMVELMERWVEKLNRNAGGLLTKAVVCLDCHDTDPRR